MDVPVVLINMFSVEHGKEEEFAKMWAEALEFIKKEPGFIDANLHRSLDPNVRFQFVNVALQRKSGSLASRIRQASASRAN